MTPQEQQQFIELWTAGALYPQIAEAMQISYGTVASRARALQQRGLIQPRERGGHKPRVTLQEKPETRAPAREAPAMTFIAVAEVQEILSTLKRLDARVEALEQTKPEAPAPPATARACGHPPANA